MKDFIESTTLMMNYNKSTVYSDQVINNNNNNHLLIGVNLQFYGSEALEGEE